jgi:hypothetical protein
MANRTIFSTHAIGFAPEGSTTFRRIQGVQSVGLTTTFNLEQVFELGQIAIYENIEGVPDVEATIEKVLDGWCPVYLEATNGSATATLSGRSTKKTTLALAIVDDAQDSVSGTPVAQVAMSGMVVSQLSYTFPTEGNMTESVTLVGNDKVWNGGIFNFAPTFPNTDGPVIIDSSGYAAGGVNRRENLITRPSINTKDVNGHVADPNCTIFPGGSAGGVAGISASGTNNKTGGVYGAHVTNMSVSTSLGRDAIFELGRRLPYFRFYQPNTEVTCEITILATQGDLVSATEVGVIGSGNNLADKSIRIATDEGLRLNLGTKNKLQSVTYTGGSTGGENVECTYTYQTFNDLEVKHARDVTAGLAVIPYSNLGN